jgi:eukaryotic-like serine/threonine-protein kinase
MWAPPHPSTTYRFGIFQVNLRRGELLRHGSPVKIQDIPFRLLTILLDRPGDIVTREELRRQLWSSNTFVGFDDGLNVAANKLRFALGDNADNPRFLETVPRRGYRFIAPVTQLEETTAVSEPQFTDFALTTPIPLEPLSDQTLPPSSQTEAKAALTRRWGGIVAGVLCTSAAMTIGCYIYLNHRHRLTDKDTIVLSDFTNTTGDQVFDGTLRQGLEVQLEQSPFLSLTSEESIQRALRMMGRPANAELTAEIALEVCERTASTVVLQSSISRLGSEYVLGLRAKDCRTGKIRAEEQAQAAKKEDVLNALSQIARQFRMRVGESVDTVEKHDKPLAEASTHSLEALKAYSTGLQVLSSTGPAAAIPLFQRAVGLDPRFAMAYAWLGRAYGDVDEPALSSESTSEAYQLRNQTSDDEKFFIGASYDLQVTGNLERALQTCETWAQVYPREMIPHAFMAGIILPVFGAYDRSTREARRVIELDPGFAVGYSILAQSYQHLDRAEEEENTLRRASELKLDIPHVMVEHYDVAFLQGNKADMERAVALGHERSGTEDTLVNREALASAFSGHLQEARNLSQRAIDLTQGSGNQETAALYETGGALREAFFGNAPAAKRSAMASLQLSRDLYVEYGSALALALSRDSSHVQTLTYDIEKRFGEDTSVRTSYLPVLRALLALNSGVPVKSIQLLQVAVPYELGKPRSGLHGSFGSLYPIYVRGLSYLALHRGSEATAEFQKILDHRGIVGSDPIGALDHLQLARAFALSGDKTKARSAYQDFLILWKDADPDIPILKQAKAEYARL